jgi:hypothetical protein
MTIFKIKRGFMYYRNDRNKIIAATAVVAIAAGLLYFLVFKSPDPSDQIKDLRLKQIELYTDLLGTDPGNIGIMLKLL